MPTIARRWDRSVGLAMLRNPQTSSRKPRSRPEKRELECWGTSALASMRAVQVLPASRVEDAREELGVGGWKMIARPGNAPGARNRPACQSLPPSSPRAAQTQHGLMTFLNKPCGLRG